MEAEKKDLEYNELDDFEIVALIRNGNNNAIDFLMEKYKNLVRKRANKLFLIGGDKDDLIQEGMIGLYKAIHDFEPGMEASFATFADLCISRQMYTAIKISNRKKNIPLNDYVSFYTPAFSESGDQVSPASLLDLFFAKNCNPEQLVIDKESTDMIELELERRLSSFENEVLEMYLSGADYREIATRLGKETKSIDNALQRIKTKLSNLLEDLK